MKDYNEIRAQVNEKLAEQVELLSELNKQAVAEKTPGFIAAMTDAMATLANAITRA